MSARSEQRRKGCEGKYRFEHYGEAQRMAEMESQFGEQYNAYKCEFCHKYHTGHIPVEMKLRMGVNLPVKEKKKKSFWFFRRVENEDYEQ